jgi:hypothetical protein
VRFGIDWIMSLEDRQDLPLDALRTKVMQGLELCHNRVGGFFSIAHWGLQRWEVAVR